MKLFFFDLETTGVNPARNGIHQISGEIVINGETMETIDFHVQPNPKATIENEASLHGADYDIYLTKRIYDMVRVSR